MGKTGIGEGISLLIHKYKYAAAVLLVGLGLMLLPTHRDPPAPLASEQPAEEATLEERLSGILSRIAGAGRVEVLLTEKIGTETHYQTDSRLDSDQDRETRQDDTVLVDGEQRSEQGLVRRRDPPRYLGALVVCQGADSPTVRLSVVEAVRCVTGLRADQIQVVKMK